MNNQRENKIIIYIIITMIILIYIAMLFIHNIVEKGKIKNTISTNIEYPSNDANGGEINNNTNNNDRNNSKNNSSTEKDNKSSKDEKEPPITIDNSDRFRVWQNNKEWNELKKLDIFNNSYFKNQSIIAPGVSGKYTFTVENDQNKICRYDITFTEENKNNINIVYRLKLNGNYIAGDENKWLTYKQINITKSNINPQTSDIYTIEWKWEDAENDTEIGTTPNANYTLYIKIDAEEK